MLFAKGTLRTHATEILLLFRLFDLLAVLAVGITTHYIIFGHFPSEQSTKIFLLFAVLGFACFAEWMGVYASGRGRRIASELMRMTIIGFFNFSLIYLFRDLISNTNATPPIPLTPWLLTWFISLVIFQVGARYTLRSFLGKIRSRGMNQRRVILVGSSPSSQKIVKAVAEHPEFGIVINGYFDDRSAEREEISAKLPRLGVINEIAAYVTSHDISQVWIAYAAGGEGRGKAVLDELRHATVNIRYILDLSTFTDTEKTLTEFGGLPLLDIDVSPLEGTGMIVKTIEDKTLSAIALVLLAPLFVILAIGVKLSSPGPVFFRQERISWNNKSFWMLKFRSMPVDVEKNTGPKWASKGENRATKFGSFLRKTSLDELPQFINVLKGDMSIVGPRPERPMFVDQFKNEIPQYMKKHMVKAGITGWAQVNGLRGDTDLEERIQYDLFYIRNWSVMFDARIALQTVVSGLINKNAY